MRKITQLAAACLESGQPFCQGNTCVSTDGDTVTLSLHGHAIAKREKGHLYVRTCGYNTHTTKNRLNGLLGVSVYQSKGQLYLNGQPWDEHEDWTRVIP